MRFDALQILFDILDNRHRVRARLTPHVNGHRWNAGCLRAFFRIVSRRIEICQARNRALFLRAVLGVTDVADANRRAADGGDDQIVEIARINHSPHRAQSQFAPPRVHVASGHVTVLADDGVAHLRNRDAVSRETVGVGPDVNRADCPAPDSDLAHACRPLKLFLDHLVGQFRQFADRTVRREGNRQDSLSFVVVFLNDWRVGVGREKPRHALHAVANVLRRVVNVAVETERGHHERPALARNRAELLDAFNGVDGFFQHLRQRGLSLFGRGAGQIGAHRHRRNVHRREAVNAELEIAGRPDDDQRQNNHRREDRTFDTNFRELLHIAILSYQLLTSMKMDLNPARVGFYRITPAILRTLRRRNELHETWRG
ncbi:MAG: hypothetical protein JMDDDDMK_03095 [Acidobacteria bacterium]|nr:hypothetical protein [Acidobacteriota bacterium]